MLATCALAVLVLYLPFAWAVGWTGGSDATALAAFSREWRFNPLLYRGLEALLPAPAARPAAAVLIGAGVLLLAWRWRNSTGPSKVGTPLPPLDQALLLLLLLAPVLNPWYWLWALPLALHRGQGWLAAGVLAAPLAHLNSSVLSEAGITLFGIAPAPYTVVWPAVLLQGLALAVAWRYRLRLTL